VAQRGPKSRSACAIGGGENIRQRLPILRGDECDDQNEWQQDGDKFQSHGQQNGGGDDDYHG
jgi:hypothetical protein